MARIGTIVRTIVFVCDNKYGIHSSSEPYYPYLILIDRHGYFEFMDNPSPEDCHKAAEQAEIGGRKFEQDQDMRFHPCVWCRAIEQDELPKGE